MSYINNIYMFIVGTTRYSSIPMFPPIIIQYPNLKMVVQLQTTFPTSLSLCVATWLSSKYEVCHSPLSRINVCSPGPSTSSCWLEDGNNWSNDLTHRDWSHILRMQRYSESTGCSPSGMCYIKEKETILLNTTVFWIFLP